MGSTWEEPQVAVALEEPQHNQAFPHDFTHLPGLASYTTNGTKSHGTIDKQLRPNTHLQFIKIGMAPP